MFVFTKPEQYTYNILMDFRKTTTNKSLIVLLYDIQSALMKNQFKIYFYVVTNYTDHLNK